MAIVRAVGSERRCVEPNDTLDLANYWRVLNHKLCGVDGTMILRIRKTSSPFTRSPELQRVQVPEPSSWSFSLSAKEANR